MLAVPSAHLSGRHTRAQSAQALVLEATTSSAPERGGFEATTYQSMARAHLSAEKVGPLLQKLAA